jgi:SNF2 family DNA or RNA helicase
MNVHLRPAESLRSSQRLISKIIKGEPAKLIVSGMGSGKTGAALDAARALLDSFEAHHILIIGPLLVAQNTWPDEIETWQHTRVIRYAVAVGDQAERAAAVAKRAEITTINFENIQWLAKHIKSIDHWYWDTVIIDESSRFKAGEKRTKTTKVKTASGEVKVRKGGNQTRFGIMTTARQKIDRIYELTGTPTPNGLYDLWGQIYLLDQGQRLGRTKSAFENRWFDKNPYTYAITPRPGAEAEIMGLISDLMVTIPQEKITDDAQFIPMSVRLPDKAMQEYLDFEKTLYSQPYDVEAVSSGVLANKLLQFANGHLYREDRSVIAVHEAKFEALDELIQQCHGENLLVFYSFKFDKDAIKKRYPHAVVANESKDFVSTWNKGKIRLGLAHPASIGHGTNLQYGGHIAAWFGLTFNLELWQQANMRLPRPGQTKQVLIYPIIAKGTYDERAVDSLQSKGATQDRIVSGFLHRP